MSDAHIGAFRQPVLQDLGLRAFSHCIDSCIKRKLDFVIVSGDLFHSNIPDLHLVDCAVKKIREARDQGIRFYVVYGSHDFSPTQASIIDVLESAGLFRKVTMGKMEGDKLELEFSIDEGTGAKICGISGRRSGIDKQYYEVLDREHLEREHGFKIFVFHGALSEYKPEYWADTESLPSSLLPRDFAYYAGGHLHEKLLIRQDGRTIAYPGTLFGGDYRDIEKSAHGLERGFWTVEFSDKVGNIDFVPISVCDYESIEYDANGKNSVQVEKDLIKAVTNLEPTSKLVLLKVKGEMAGGKVSEINFGLIKKNLYDKGALDVLLNYQNLSSAEFAQVKIFGEEIHEIEERLFRENLGALHTLTPKLKGESSVKLAQQLLSELRNPKKENELKSTYESRIVDSALETFGIKEAFD